jgi:hypothetical protein
MRPVICSLGLLAVIGLSGCGKPAIDRPAAHHGRYVGIGIYAAGSLWERMTAAVPPAKGSPDAARLSDDEQVIVVVDSDTGEIRQCGNLTGYCVATNPWTQALTSQQQTPVDLKVHALSLPAFEPAPAAQPAPEAAKAP